jgi:hypothetical protein
MAHLLLLITAGLLSPVNAQPAPSVQAGITAAIKSAANATGPLDYTAFVNPFIGTDNFGDVWYAPYAPPLCVGLNSPQPWSLDPIRNGETFTRLASLY